MKNDKDELNFGKNIRFLRKVYRLSQKEMAKIMGVSVYCVRKAEKGIFTRSLHTQALVNLSRYFHIRPSAFFASREEWSVAMPMNRGAEIRQ